MTTDRIEQAAPDVPPFTEGQTVELVPHPGWHAELQKFAEQGKTATVQRCFIPLGCKVWNVGVVFDHRRKRVVDYFKASDLRAKGTGA